MAFISPLIYFMANFDNKFDERLKERRSKVHFCNVNGPLQPHIPTWVPPMSNHFIERRLTTKPP